jgi:hypothetical protein
MRRSDVLLTLICLCAAGAAFAQSLPPSLLKPAQRLPAPAQEELRRHQARLDAMATGERDDFRQRVAEWDALAPAVQRQRRDAWQAWHALDATERARLQAAARDYATLPPDRQQALHAQFDALDDSERRGWLLGPVLGAEWPHLHPLFAQVPERERGALLDALRGADPAARADLAVLAQRTPPQDRDALRRQWLAVPAARRGAWLRDRLER